MSLKSHVDYFNDEAAKLGQAKEAHVQEEAQISAHIRQKSNHVDLRRLGEARKRKWTIEYIHWHYALWPLVQNHN